jgi:hypothetical protein
MIKTLFVDEFRFLTFRPVSAAVATHWKAFLAFGLFFTWVAGIGRYWDNPRAHLWQQLGLGSVIYVFLLALVVWILLAPLRPKNWSYCNVLLFITLTAPPAILYAIPVERFMTSEAARAANSWFLAVVAAWRVGLFWVFLHRVARLPGEAIVFGSLLPLTIIVAALSMLNLEHAVFSIMGGINPEDLSPNDGAFAVVTYLSILSLVILPFVILVYLILIYGAWRRSKAAAITNAVEHSSET